MTEIKKNPMVNRFEDISRSYGVSGIYVSWLPSGLNEGGSYFLCGLDAATLASRDIDMNKILNNMMASNGHIRTDVTAFKIDGRQPLMVHRDIVNYCKQLDILKNVYAYFGKPIPSNIDSGVIEVMKMAWEHFLEPNQSAERRCAHENSLKASIEVAEKGINKNSPEYKKHNYLDKGYYDSGRGKVYNWVKMHFFKHKNEVSLEHLVNHAGRINFATVSYASFPDFKKAMENRPDILYHVSDIRGEILDIRPEDGFGSDKNNDRRFYTVHYPTAHTKDVENILLKINYPEEFSRTLADIDPGNYGTEFAVIPDEYFDAFRSLCKQNRINLCIDQTTRATFYGGIPVAFSAQHSAKVYNMLTATARVYENDAPPRMVPVNNLPNYSYCDEIKEPPLKEGGASHRYSTRDSVNR